MSTYELLMDEIVARLKGTVDNPAFEAAGIEVAKSPNVQGQHDKLVPSPTAKGRIRVSCLQDRYGTDENDTSMLVGEATMDRVIYYNLSIESRVRYGTLGALDMCEKSLRLLLGYKSEEFGGELYAFATSMESFEDNVWYYRVIVRWKHLPLQPLDSFRVNGDEETGYLITEVNFTPSQINVLDGNTTGYLQYLTDQNGNYVTVPQGYILVKQDG